jgi:hypothetical protein
VKRLSDLLLAPLDSALATPKEEPLPTCPATRTVAEPALLKAVALPDTRPVAEISVNAAPPREVVAVVEVREKEKSAP